ncbi:hypothetical protein Gpo141_00007679 [Globisporangium polare]
MSALSPVTDTPAAPTAPESAQEQQEQCCSYPGKKCTTERARKPNGSLHKLCELHRRRANLNQKRLQQKRRLLRDKLFKRAARSAGDNEDDLVDLIEASSSAVRKPSPTPPSSSTRRASSSPVSMDATADFAVASMSSSSSSSAMSYAAQLHYLFADPLLQPDASMLTSEDVFMLQDVLFDDASYFYPQTNNNNQQQQPHSWFAQV